LIIGLFIKGLKYQHNLVIEKQVSTMITELPNTCELRGSGFGQVVQSLNNNRVTVERFGAGLGHQILVK
jgi:hypothetical protein